MQDNNKIIQIMPLPAISLESEFTRLAYVPTKDESGLDTLCEVVGLALTDSGKIRPIVKLRPGSKTMDFAIIDMAMRELQYSMEGREFEGNRVGDPAWETTLPF